jgi:hypothetical protein
MVRRNTLVVPAKAGTHTPRLLVLDTVLDTIF